jgi:C4-dicarboxylate-specific signal transduction histidine kinase
MTSDLEHKYAELLIWSWGHNVISQTMTIRDLVYLIKRYLTDASPDFARINSLLDEIDKVSKELATDSPSPLKLQQISLNTLIEDRIRKCETRQEGSPYVVEADLDPTLPFVNANPVWLGRILDILMENAVEATKDSNNRLIQIRTLIDSGGVTITVRDNGRGFDSKLLTEILAKPLALPDGRGRGLYIARLAAEIYGGTVSVAETTSTGTTMTAWLPLPERSDSDD